METIEISVKDFLAKVAAPRGMTLSDLERQLRDELRCGESLKMFVGNDKLYVMSNEAIKEYFNIKDAPPSEEAAPVAKEAAAKMMDFDVAVETIKSIAKKAEPAPAEGQKRAK